MHNIANAGKSSLKCSRKYHKEEGVLFYGFELKKLDDLSGLAIVKSFRIYQVNSNHTDRND